jgi:predicted O-linked N-acetylglucosamine transferase (SPINDLY family)
MDYVLADPWSVPHGEEDQFTEEVWRLPETRFCFAAPDAATAVGPLPALSSGHLTYGCFGNLAKAGNAVFAAWAKVLTAAPTSIMFLKAKQLKDPAVRARVLARFREYAIGEDRLIIEGPTPRAAYLAAYGRIDMVLDTFPYPGGTTTLEGLWMGVPAVTLRGDRMLSRQGESILMNAGLEDWIASDAESYARLAIAKSEPRALAELRRGLRERLQASPLMDAPRFAAHLEVALREMWVKWCSRQRG